MSTAQTRTLKVFVPDSSEAKLGPELSVIERYPGFVLGQATPAVARKLAKTHPVEDITDQYTISLGETAIEPGPTPERPDGAGAGAARDVRSERAAGTTRRMATGAPSSGKHHYLVQFVGPIKKVWLTTLGKRGAEVREPRGGFSYVVRADAATVERLQALPFVRWVGHLPHAERVAPGLRPGAAARKRAPSLPRRRVLPRTYTLSFFGPAELRKALPALPRLGFQVLDTNERARLVIVEASGTAAEVSKAIAAASAIHGLKFIRERAIKRPSNDVACKLMFSGHDVGNPRALTGAGEVVAICDTGLDSGDPGTVHRDFRGRVLFIKSYPMTADFDGLVSNPRGNDGPADTSSGHGTHVAGSAVGDGSASTGDPNRSTPIRALAHKAKLVFQAVEQEMRWNNPQYFERYGRFLLAGIPQDLTVLLNDAYARRARIHSNSWGGGDPGAYDPQCEQLDRYVWEHPHLCVLAAAGNDGTDQDGDGKINPMSVTSPSTAKNCITVGASENRRTEFNTQRYGDWWPGDYPVAPFKRAAMADDPTQVVAFSSRGPTADGRLKPEVLAPGTFILSTRSTRLADNATGWAPFPDNKLYFHMGGTSMATPLVAGAVALLREYLRKEQRVANPTAALLKAGLIAGARRLPGRAGVADNHQGYGRVDLDAIVAPRAPVSASFFDDTRGLQTGALRSRVVEVKAAGHPLRIALAYSDFPGPVLVNNLNLIVTAPDGRRHIGNAGNGSATGAYTLDTRNNTELVEIPRARTGRYTIDIVGSNVPEGPQPFALVVLGAI